MQRNLTWSLFKKESTDLYLESFGIEWQFADGESAETASHRSIITSPRNTDQTRFNNQNLTLTFGWSSHCGWWFPVTSPFAFSLATTIRWTNIIAQPTSAMGKIRHKPFFFWWLVEPDGRRRGQSCFRNIKHRLFGGGGGFLSFPLHVWDFQASC